MSEAKVKAKKEKKGGGSIIKIAILIVLLLILVAGAGFGGYLYAVKTGVVHVVTQVETVTVAEKKVEETTVLLEEFLLNLADTDSTHVIKTKIAVAYDSKNKKIAKEIETKKEEVRDAVISVLSSKKASEFTPKGREDIKKEIVSRVNTVLTTGKITNIYYSDIIVQ